MLFAALASAVTLKTSVLVASALLVPVALLPTTNGGVLNALVLLVPVAATERS